MSQNHPKIDLFLVIKIERFLHCNTIKIQKGN